MPKPREYANLVLETEVGAITLNSRKNMTKHSLSHSRQVRDEHLRSRQPAGPPQQQALVHKWSPRRFTSLKNSSIAEPSAQQEQPKPLFDYQSKLQKQNIHLKEQVSVLKKQLQN